MMWLPPLEEKMTVKKPEDSRERTEKVNGR
jgi:hypothetical protein